MPTTVRTSAKTPLRLATSDRGDVRVIALSGRLDETFEHALARALSEFLEKGRVRVVADLAGLDYLNSRGVSGFIAAVDALREAGGDLKLAAAPPQAKLVLERLGVDRLLQGFGTVDEAVLAFKIPIQEFLTKGGLDVFVSAAKGRTFHSSGCASVKRMKSVKILHSKKSPRDAGLKPCPRCCS